MTGLQSRGLKCRTLRRRFNKGSNFSCQNSGSVNMYSVSRGKQSQKANTEAEYYEQGSTTRKTLHIYNRKYMAGQLDSRY